MSILALLGVALAASLLLWHLDSLTPAWSAGELATRSASSSLHAILNDPINAPFKLVVYGLIKIRPHSIMVVRLASALFGALTIGLFFFIVRSWHSSRIAWLASLLLATSTWFLHTARTGTPDVLLFGLLILMALGLLMQRTRHRRLLVAIMAFSVAVAFYVPGIVWFLLFTAVWQRRVIRDSLYKIPRLVAAGSLAGFLLILAPLAWAASRNWHLIFAVFGLPEQLPKWLPVVKNLLDVPLNLFVRGPYLPGFWVGRTPVLDVFGTVLFVFGVYAYWQHRRLARFASLLSIFLLTDILVALGGPVTLSLLLPFVYLVIATGLAFLLGEWLSVFPRNPLARGFGLAIVTLAVLLSCTYQLDRYFIAWPRQPATKQAFAGQLVL